MQLSRRELLKTLAVACFYSTFGMDEPMRCYDDIEATDTFFVWGANFAEAQPTLYSQCAR